MALADSCDVSQTRPVPGLQHGFFQLGRRVEGIPSQGVAPKHIIAMIFSTEAIVAVAVAVAFALLSFGAIAREQGQGPVRSWHNAYVGVSNVHLSPVAASDRDVLGFY
jgi:hypothetical protein